jgi:hypothetical protein
MDSEQEKQDKPSARLRLTRKSLFWLYLRIRDLRCWLDSCVIGGNDAPRGVLWRLQLYLIIQHRVGTYMGFGPSEDATKIIDYVPPVKDHE